MLRQLFTAPNQLTLLRLIFIPFIIINIVDNNHRWALILLVIAGLSDALDGLLARTLHQQTKLGQYLDPIADKLLISTLFLVLSILHLIPWKYTVLVFSRDLIILLTCAVLYATTSIRDFRPSIFGKINTGAQVVTIFFVLLFQVDSTAWIYYCRKVGLYATFAFTLISGLHYVFQIGQRIRAYEKSGRPAASAQ
ncbi:MAG: CDP-diacylglycerol--glycerol-3-phosphate 3-phosphatidyltransferase [Acidobacteriia bacterium]|nr:CDP-diacylglycerol--glycerol-3-phosphate 3-phosphatidyltransferase [Terriglobia bacterium]